MNDGPTNTIRNRTYLVVHFVRTISKNLEKLKIRNMRFSKKRAVYGGGYIICKFYDHVRCMA
ncbi:MAG: hypothetical protein ACJAZ4_001198 [Neptuniibacter pectenicola]